MSDYKSLFHANYEDGVKVSKNGMCYGCAAEYFWTKLGIPSEVVSEAIEEAFNVENRSRSRRSSVQLGEDS